MVLSPRELDKKATQLRRGRGVWMYWANVPWVSSQQREAESEAPGWRCLYQAPLNSQGGTACQLTWSESQLIGVVAMARLLIALVASASATLELTHENFDQEVLESGKSAFIKFLAPW